MSSCCCLTTHDCNVLHEHKPLYHTDLIKSKTNYRLILIYIEKNLKFKMSCGYEQRWNQKSFLQLTSKTKATNQTNSYKENNVHK